MNYCKVLIFALAAFLLNACSSSSAGTGSFTIISDQDDKIKKHYVVTGAEVSEKECSFFWLLPPIWIADNISEEALLAKVLEENNADALINAEFKSSFIFPLLFFRSCTTVSGIPVKLRSAQ